MMSRMKGPRLVFWELTKRCNLRCAHCRAEAAEGDFAGELDTEQAYRVIDDIAVQGSPILVLTGGEPLYRTDLFEIAGHAGSRGLRTALATNGTMIDERIAARIGATGFERVSISIDGSTAASHDGFRGIPGSFEKALAGARCLATAGVGFQFNTTITRRNVGEIDDILDLAASMKAKALHAFMLVPVGCGVQIEASEMLDREHYEEVLVRLYHRTKDSPLEFKATCAPHYYRIIRQEAKREGRAITFESDGMAAMTRGCLAGSGVCFISHRGEVQPCGYLPLSAGNVLSRPFQEIWENSALFRRLRDLDGLKGKCGACEYKSFCAGCRARSYHHSGDYMDEEPYCVYVPPRVRGKA